MRYGDGWAYDSTHSHQKQSQLRLTRKMTGVQIRRYQLALRQRPMIQEAKNQTCEVFLECRWRRFRSQHGSQCSRKHS